MTNFSISFELLIEILMKKNYLLVIINDVLIVNINIQLKIITRTHLL